MGTTHGHGADLRWAFAAAALGAKAAHLAAHAARGHERQGGCGPRTQSRGPQAGGPQFGWMFGGGGPGPGPWGQPGPPWARGKGGPWGHSPGSPWGRGGRGTRARKGNVRAAILALLAEEPRNGYQIIQEINERSDGGWKPSPGAVYPALQQLADEGLIHAEEAAGRRTFQLTDEGRAYVQEHADELTEPWAAMAPDFGEGVPDLFKNVAQTGAAVMQIVHSGSPEQVAKAKDVIAETRRRLYLILADDDAPEDAAAPEDDPGPDAPGPSTPEE